MVPDGEGKIQQEDMGTCEGLDSCYKHCKNSEVKLWATNMGSEYGREVIGELAEFMTSLSFCLG